MAEKCIFLLTVILPIMLPATASSISSNSLPIRMYNDLILELTKTKIGSLPIKNKNGNRNMIS